jgi:hypothetical protein
MERKRRIPGWSVVFASGILHFELRGAQLNG